MPWAIRLERLGLRSVMDGTVVVLIRCYQRYLSPRKGFTCAHSRLHHSASCSEYFRRMVKLQGTLKATGLLQRRLHACRQASIILRAQSDEPTDESRRDRRRYSIYDWCDLSGCGPDIADCGGCDLDGDGQSDCGDCNPDCDILSCDGCDFNPFS